MSQAGFRDRELRAAWRRRSQLVRAVRAELVGFDYFAFAIGARGVEVAFAVGAEVETPPYTRTALRAGIRQWLTHQKIDHEADDQVARQKDDREKRPQS